MLVQWCLRGFRAVNGIDDAAAERMMRDEGIPSAWIWNSTVSGTRGDVFQIAHQVLSRQALDDHVNNFGTAWQMTPYVSLTAGVVVPDGAGGSRTVGAWNTAANFATGGGQVEGYVFECWVLVGPKPAPELPGFAEEVRDLNAAAQFSLWHEEGEIAAKLVVPPRQIRKVVKLNKDGSLAQQPGENGNMVDWIRTNPHFVEPERVTDLRQMVA